MQQIDEPMHLCKDISYVWRHCLYLKALLGSEGLLYVWRYFLCLKAFFMSEGIPYVGRLCLCLKTFLMFEGTPYVWRLCLCLKAFIRYEGIPYVWRHFLFWRYSSCLKTFLLPHFLKKATVRGSIVSAREFYLIKYLKHMKSLKYIHIYKEKSVFCVTFPCNLINSHQYSLQIERTSTNQRFYISPSWWSNKFLELFIWT